MVANYFSVQSQTVQEWSIYVFLPDQIWPFIVNTFTEEFKSLAKLYTDVRERNNISRLLRALE